MDNLPKIRIEVKNGLGTQIFVDNKEIKGVREVRFKKTGGEVPVLEMDFILCDVEINGQWLPQLPEIFEAYYERKKTEEIKGMRDEMNG